MQRFQISETEYRWYDASAAWAAIDGEVARATLKDGFWAVDVFQYGADKEMRPMTASFGARDIDHADEIVTKEASRISAELLRLTAMVKAAEAEGAARKREVEAEQDRMTRDLLRQLDLAEREAAQREVSDDFYYTSGRRTEDQARIAGLKVQIENRRREVAAKMEAA